MWIEPVTLGGGMTMEKVLPGFGSARNSSLSHPGLGPTRLDLLRVVGLGEIFGFRRLGLPSADSPAWS